MPYQCPVCAYAELAKPPVDLAICPSCGTQFGYDDAGMTYDELRQAWVDSGAPWFSHAIAPPEDWNGYSQLLKAGLALMPISQHEDDFSEVTFGASPVMALR